MKIHNPPPGELVLVKGRQMHIHCQGEGSPSVLLDAGQGGWSIGWSEPGPDGRTPQHAADDLVPLLEAAAIAGPYLVVGFSHAGLATRIYAAQHPETAL